MSTKTIRPIHPDWTVVGHNAYYGCDIHRWTVRGIGRYVVTTKDGKGQLRFFRSGNRGKSPDRYWKQMAVSAVPKTAQDHARWAKGATKAKASRRPPPKRRRVR